MFPKAREYRQGVWRDLGGTLEKWASPVSLNFTPEYLQNPENLDRYLREYGCIPGRPKEAEIIWGLAYAYSVLFCPIPERESVSKTELESLQAEKENLQAKGESLWAEGKFILRKTVTNRDWESPDWGEVLQAKKESLQAKIENLWAEGEKVQTEIESLWAERESSNWERVSDLMTVSQPAQLQGKSMPMLVAPVEGKKWQLGMKRRRNKRRWEQHYQHLTSKNGWNDYAWQLDENIISWMLWCRNTGASNVDQNGKEACQLAGIARDPTIDRGISRKHPLEGNFNCCKGKISLQGRWMDHCGKGYPYLKELAMVELLYNPMFDPDNPIQTMIPRELVVHQLRGRNLHKLHQQFMTVHWQECYIEKEDI